MPGAEGSPRYRSFYDFRAPIAFSRGLEYSAAKERTETMNRKRLSRLLALLPAVLLMLVFGPEPAVAAGCHTVCKLTMAPDCLDCGYTAFQNIFCMRGGCDTCFEDSCAFAIQEVTSQVAPQVPQKGVCPAGSSYTQSIPKIVKVETLATRS